MKFKYNRPGLFCASALLMVAATVLSCSDDIEAGKKIDEKPYETIYENNGYLLDARTNKVSNIVELYNETYTTQLKMGLTKAPASAVNGTVSYDAAYLEEYNKEHETSFELYPAELVSFADNGALTIAASAYESPQIDITIKAGSGLDEDKTYVIPVVLTINDAGISLKENASHCVYLVKDRRHLTDCYKGEDLPKSFLYLEINDCNPLNTLVFELENGKLIWDAVVIFAANITYHQEELRPYIRNNENIQFLLDNYDDYLKPLQDRGIKVFMGLLGGGDQSGLAQLSPTGCKDFAKEIAYYIDTYGFDGVNFDDEWSKDPDLSNPAFTNKSREAGNRLMLETKRLLPDKLVSVYTYGSIYGISSVDGVDVSEYVDIVVPDYPDSPKTPIGGLTRADYAYCAIEYTGSRRYYSWITDSAATTMLNQGWGWFMAYALEPSNFDYVERTLPGLGTLWGSPFKTPTVFYKKDDLTPYVYPDDLEE